MTTIENIANPSPEDIIIDVRHPEDVEKSPLKFAANKILSIPFFNLAKCSCKLDKSQSYLLFCDKGIMSRLHADALCKKGFKKVGVFTPRSALKLGHENS